MTRPAFARTFFEIRLFWSAKMYPAYLWSLLGGSWPGWKSAHVRPHKIRRSRETTFFARLRTCGLTVLPFLLRVSAKPGGVLAISPLVLRRCELSRCNSGAIGLLPRKYRPCNARHFVCDRHDNYVFVRAPFKLRHPWSQLVIAAFEVLQH
jgi:hypothetical protein